LLADDWLAVCWHSAPEGPGLLVLARPLARQQAATARLQESALARKVERKCRPSSQISSTTLPSL